MRVNVDGRTFLVHWESSIFHPQFGDTSRELRKTTCYLRMVQDSGEPTEISKHTVRQNYRDKDNLVLARKLSLAGAIGHLPKETRAKFWEEYKKNARITPNSVRAENKKLKVSLAAVTKELERIKQEIQEEVAS